MELNKFDKELDEFFVQQIAALLLKEEKLETEIRMWEGKRLELRRNSNQS